MDLNVVRTIRNILKNLYIDQRAVTKNSSQERNEGNHSVGSKEINKVCDSFDVTFRRGPDTH